MSAYDDIRAELRTCRREQGISLRALAARIGVAVSTLTAWEKGDREPGAGGLFAWVHGLGSTLGLDPADRYTEGWHDALAHVLPHANALHAALADASTGPPKEGT